MSRANRIAGSAIAATLFVPAKIYAFSEDLCVGLNLGRVQVENCVPASYCDVSSTDPTAPCLAQSAIQAFLATLQARQGLARSMVHVDATYYLAQAVGFDPYWAYWIAAYDEVVDAGVYIPFNYDGKPVEEIEDGIPAYTPLLNGWSRMSAAMGGFLYHFVSPFTPDGETLVDGCPPSAPPLSPDPSCGGPDTPCQVPICGQTPSLEDTVHEGMLVHFHDWALGLRENQCVDGFTEPDEDGNYFMGEHCYKDDPTILTNPEDVHMYIEGTVPLASDDGPISPFCTYSGKQIAQCVQPNYKSPTTNDDFPTQIQYADPGRPGVDGLQEILTGVYGEEVYRQLTKGYEEDFVSLVKLGIYLHILQDRISHYQCGDASIVSPPDPNGDIFVQFDEEQCAQDIHAYRHFQEIGHPGNLPYRDQTALEYTWDALEEFAAAYPQWLNPAARPLDKGTAVALILGALEFPTGCKRLKAFMQLIDDNGFTQLPGNEGCDLSKLCAPADFPPWNEIQTGETQRSGDLASQLPTVNRRLLQLR